MGFNNTKIFFQGSKTYFTSSLFFPQKIREQVFTLYAFVRVADDYVDQAIQDPKKIKKFKSIYNKAKSGKKVDNYVVKKFVKLSKHKNFKDEWIDAFLEAMIQDTKKSEYKTIKQTTDYIYGSAEVIGLMMASIMNLEKGSYKYAKMLGRSMQYANFIRDIDEDNSLGRQYIPSSQLKKFNLDNLEKSYILNNKENFKKLIRSEINRYRSWQKTAEEGFKYIPKRYLVAIKTASDMYKWTINEIENNPLIVFEKKVKPSRLKIITTAIKNIFKINLKTFKLAIPYVFIFNHFAS